MGEGIPVKEVVIVFFGEDCAGVVDACTVILLPDFCDASSWFSFDHGDLHDFPEFARAGISEGHIKGHSSQHDYYIYQLMSIQIPIHFIII